MDDLTLPVEELRTKVREKLGLKGQLLGQDGLLGRDGLKAILGEPGRRIPQPLWEKLPPEAKAKIQSIRKLRPEVMAKGTLLEKLKGFRPSIVDRPYPKPTGMAVEGEPAYPYNTLSVIVE